MTAQQIRVFISSPGDVADERTLLRGLFKEELPYDPFLRGRLTFDVVSWDDPAAPAPMPAALTPQEAVNRFGCRPSECDIVLVVLWSRLGTRLDVSAFAKSSGEPYQSGTEWEFEDALHSSRDPKPEVLVYRRTEVPHAALNDSRLTDKLEQFRRVEAFFERFSSPDGSARRTWAEYRTPTELKDLVERHLRKLLHDRVVGERIEPHMEVAPRWGHSPYPGLRPFTTAEAPIFFGRGREVDALIRKLRDSSQRVVVVVGASGTGKSSLIQAGLLPRLSAGAIGGREQWQVLPVKPGTLEDPFLSMSSELHRMLSAPNETAAQMAKALAADVQVVKRYFDKVALAGFAGAAIVLLVDQLEELFTMVPEKFRKPFLELLRQAADDPRVYVMATLREDFLSRCVAEAAIAPMVQAGTFVLGPPGPVELIDMIRKPAAQAGIVVEDGLVEQILRDGGADSAALPLVAFCLHELYENEKRRSDAFLTLDAYNSMGGLRGAIGRHSSRLFQEVAQSPGVDVEAILPQLFLKLVRVDEKGAAVRKRASRGDLPAEGPVFQLIEALTRGHLLVAEGAGTEATVALAHDTLLREWQRLADWIRDHADDVRTEQQAREAADDWKRADDKDKASFLYPEKWLMRAHQALRNLGQDWASREEPMRSFLRPGAEWLLIEIESAETTHERRAEIGDLLDALEHHRKGVGLSPDGLPDIVWCDVPEGSVTLEENGGVATVAPFRVSRYVITNAQFNAFVEAADGYHEAVWWDGMPEGSPDGPVRPRFSGPSRPRDNVSWYEAVAFCRWLSRRVGFEVHLPTEFEWQQAATYGDRTRVYPWGQKWDPGRCNSSANELNRTTAVGMYPHGGSRGIEDLAGNVWEWCLNKYDRPREIAIDASDEWRAVRGGSWLDDEERCRAASRSVRHGKLSDRLRGASIGFRVMRPGST